LSRLYQQICLAHKIPFINTSKNFEWIIEQTLTTA
jgi:hypothetical protein